MPYRIIVLTAVSALFFASSLFAQPGVSNVTPTVYSPQTGRPMTMGEGSLTFQAPVKHVFKKGDIIYVEVKDRKKHSTTAANQRKKKIESIAQITAWTKIGGLFQMPVPVTGGLPEIGGTIDHKTQNQGRLTREDTNDFDIACRITDIRDNGNLVIEGTRRIGTGEERCTTTLTGIIRPDKIGPGFRVKSGEILDIQIDDTYSGSVADTVRRPWGTRLFEQLKPF
jgi:flagellar L-ring protein precursor FlgH